MAIPTPITNTGTPSKNPGLKTLSGQFRDDLLRVNLATPPDIVVGLSDYGGELAVSAYRSDMGADGIVRDMNVSDPGNVVDLSVKLREYLFKRNLQTPTDIEAAVIELSANQSETLRNLGSLGNDATINWQAVVVDPGTIDNAAFATREANLSRNKQRDLTDPSESNVLVTGEGYNYTSLLQTIGLPGVVNNFIVPNFQSVSSPDNKTNVEAQKLDLKINRYAPDEYHPAVIRENILNEVYKKLTYVTDYTTSFSSNNSSDYVYRNFYNINSQATLDNILTGESTLVESDTMLMNVAAYMLNYNLQARFEQNLYNETLGKINLYNQNYDSQFPPSTDPLEMIRIAKDPMDNLLEKNYTITVPRNFVGKTAQFLLGLEGVVSPFDLWESVDLGGNDLTPTCFVSNAGNVAKRALDPTFADAADIGYGADPTGKKNKINDDDLVRKTGGGQRWSLYENLLMNKYSPKFDTNAELIHIGKQKHPKGNYYLGSSSAPPIDLLQVDGGYNLINNNVLSAAFRKTDNATYDDTQNEIVWTSEYDKGIEDKYLNKVTDAQGYLVDQPSDYDLYYGKTTMEYSTDQNFRPCSLMDITQNLLWAGKVDSPISNIKTRFRDGQFVYSKGGAVSKVQVKKATGSDKNVYHPLTDKQEQWDNGFCRTWTKVKPFRKVAHLVRYGELIRRERNSVIDRNANYNIFPSALNVGTIYDQNMIESNGEKDRFANKNFDKVRARKYMFSIENLAWKDSDKFDDLPTYEQGPSGGRVMWFPPYGVNFNETSTAKWTTHEFLGRPEPIYTYNSTERTGTLSWMIVVDHPTILNVLVQKELAALKDEDVDAVLDAFFAGCLEYDIFELARIWGVFTNADIAYFKMILDGDYKYPATPNNNTKGSINYKAGQSNTPTNPDTKWEEIIKLFNGDGTNPALKLFFPNDVPNKGVTDLSYLDILADYKNDLTDGTGTMTSSSGEGYYYNLVIGKESVKIDDDNPYWFYSGDRGINVDFDLESTAVQTAFQTLSTELNSLPAGKELKIQINAYASALNEQVTDYNKELSIRRAISVINWLRDILTKQGFDVSEFKNDGNGKYSSSVTKGGRIYITIVGTPDNLIGKTTSKMLSETNYPQTDATTWSDPNVPEYMVEYMTDSPPSGVADMAFYVENDFINPEEGRASVRSYPASYARRAELKVSIETVPVKPDISLIPIELKPKPVASGNLVNKRDIATRILNKLIGENEYFEYLSENSPVVFKSMKEKLKYFSPAFHSTTPEGLNSRLTFLQQCLRPGDTIKPNSQEQQNIVNTAFGKPPICILRIGDFYNTKIIIETLQIDYVAAGSSVTYDLNPEGIGVQPMIAKVTLGIKYIGGAGLREPVAQLQNALSFNYYANADIYESRSYGQTNLDERYLENLELAYGTDVTLDLAQLKLDEYQNIKFSEDTNFDYLGKIVKTFEPIEMNSPIVPTPGDPVYNDAHKIKNDVDMVHYYDLDYTNVFKDMYTSYSDYSKNYLETLGTLGLDNQLSAKDTYKFMMYMIAGIVDLSSLKNTSFKSTDFGKNTSVKTTDFMQFTDINMNNRNYFSVGYDSYKKSNNYAPVKLHLYPQSKDRIVEPVTAKLDTFSGCVLPRYLDPDYINSNIDVCLAGYLKKLSCEEWLLFQNDVLRNDFDKIHPYAKIVFRNLVKQEAIDYVAKIKEDIRTVLDFNVTLFTVAYADMLKTLPIINGVDGGTSVKGINYLEVAPQLSTGTTTTDVKTFFGKTNSDALSLYPMPWPEGDGYSIVDFSTVSFKDAMLPAIKFNIKYLNTELTKPYWASATYPTYDFTSGSWSAPTTVTSVFEKLNYEFSYFGDLTMSVLSQDTVTLVTREFGFTKSTRFFDSLTPDAIHDIQVAFGLGTATDYSKNMLLYTGATNSILHNDMLWSDWWETSYSYEDNMFFGFVKERLLSDDFINKMSTAIKTPLFGMFYSSNESFNLENFIAEYKHQKNHSIVTSLTTSTDKTITELSRALTQTTENWQPIQNFLSKGAITTSNYIMRMFEVDFSRANATGRDILNKYYRFKEDNKGVLDSASIQITQANIDQGQQAGGPNE